MGMHHKGERVDFALRLDMHHISYDLDQVNFVDNERRLLDQHWTEGTLSSDVGARLSGVGIQYAVRLTLGTGRPGVQRTWGWGREAGFADSAVGALGRGA